MLLLIPPPREAVNPHTLDFWFPSPRPGTLIKLDGPLYYHHRTTAFIPRVVSVCVHGRGLRVQHRQIVHVQGQRPKGAYLKGAVSYCERGKRGEEGKSRATRGKEDDAASRICIRCPSLDRRCEEKGAGESLKKKGGERAQSFRVWPKLCAGPDLGILPL